MEKEWGREGKGGRGRLIICTYRSVSYQPIMLSALHVPLRRSKHCVSIVTIKQCNYAVVLTAMQKNIR